MDSCHQGREENLCENSNGKGRKKSGFSTLTPQGNPNTSSNHSKQRPPQNEHKRTDPTLTEAGGWCSRSGLGKAKNFAGEKQNCGAKWNLLARLAERDPLCSRQKGIGTKHKRAQVEEDLRMRHLAEGRKEGSERASCAHVNPKSLPPWKCRTYMNFLRQKLE